MKHENNIDKYFSRVKQNPPLMDIEQVRQVITEAEVKAKVETEVRVKKGHRNLLKFTIMTTLFAIIISAVLCWPGANETQDTIPIAIGNKTQNKGQEIVSRHKTQDTRPLGSDANFTDVKSASSSYAGTENTESNNDNKLLAMANVNENSSGLASNQTNAAIGNSEKRTQTAQQNGQQSSGFDYEAIKPIDGSKFVLKLSREEMEQIGFQFTDSSINYYNKIGHDCLVFFYRIHKKKVDQDTIVTGSSECYLHQTDNSPKEESNDPKYLKILQQLDTNSNSLSVKNFEFYPVCQTNTFYTGFKGITGYDASKFEEMNDSLLPVYIPVSTILPERQDLILWFKTNDEMLSLLSKNHLLTIELFKKYKAAKHGNRNIDIVVYKGPKLVDESKVINLTKDELKNIGFQFYSDSTIFKGGALTEKVKLSFFKHSYMSSISHIDSFSARWNDGCLPALVTLPDGDPLIKVLNFKTNNLTNAKKYEQQIQLFIPVKLNASELLLKDVIFWFYPTEAFFNALPTRISKDLRKEYNYVVTEDKSTLEKPECKYFDECKNTLGVSSFKIYPNPANTNATVSFTLPEAIDGRITLVDLAGRERQVLQPQTSFAKGQHSITVDLGNVPEGIYLLTLYSDKGVQTQRVIVAR